MPSILAHSPDNCPSQMPRSPPPLTHPDSPHSICFFHFFFFIFFFYVDSQVQNITNEQFCIQVTYIQGVQTQFLYSGCSHRRSAKLWSCTKERKTKREGGWGVKEGGNRNTKTKSGREMSRCCPVCGRCRRNAPSAVPLHPRLVIGA